VVALSNLCVDVVQPVPVLPQLANAAQRAAFYDALLASAPPESQWEVGGNTNFAIAASRLGLDCVCLGHTGDDTFGSFMADILRQEGVAVQQLLPAAPPGPTSATSAGRPPTLLCFVLVDPSNGHAFCSRFDFDARPLLTCSSQLPREWTETLAGTRGVFVNGFVFDDLQPSTVMAAVAAAQQAGATLAFDAGPRAGKLMRDVNPGCAAACATLLATSDVLLLTQDEAHTLTGAADADAAGQLLLGRSAAADPWVIIKMGSKGAVALTRGKTFPPRVALPAMAVTPDELQDTVGCGDSFAAAVLLGRTRGHDLAATLALANAVGAATATGRGAGRNVARLKHVRSLLDATAGDSAAEEAARLAARRALDLVSAVAA
jgi:sugar/nucleoside kinase (ribokinase family)